jgi:hypothetical protein
MNEHAQHVLGVEIVFMLEQAEMLLQSMEMPSIPVIEQGKSTSSKTTSTFPAMLFPRGAELYALYIDGNGIIFARTPCHMGVFFLQQHWQQLGHVLPKDSVCRAIVYRNKAGKLQLGVYDLLQLSGVKQTGSSIFERQKVLDSLFKKASAGPEIVAYWVGEEGCLLEHMKNSVFFESLPFEIDNMLRIVARPGQEDLYKVVLRPLLIG